MTKTARLSALTSLAMAISVSGCAPASESDSAGTAAVRFDIEADDVSGGACLALAKLQKRLHELPQEATLRRYTRSFELESKTRDDKPIRRNFSALAAIANFTFDESSTDPLHLMSARIRQTKCESLSLESELFGDKKYTIAASEKKSKDATRRLLLSHDDGSEIEIVLKGPRSMVVKTKGLLQDPCPGYPQAAFARTEVIEWGPRADVEKAPISVDRGLLESIATAVVAMPAGLAEIATYDTRATVSADAIEFRALKLAKINDNVLKCPYRATPPSGEEPPPPPNESEDGSTEP